MDSIIVVHKQQSQVKKPYSHNSALGVLTVVPEISVLKTLSHDWDAQPDVRINVTEDHCQNM